MGVPSARSGTGGSERVLLVGICTGTRCAAVRRLASERTAPDSRELIRSAVRRRPDAVMVDLPCPGLCSQAAVAVVGAALSAAGRMSWLGQPTCLVTTDRGQQAHDLAAWIIGDAADLRTLPCPSPPS